MCPGFTQADWLKTFPQAVHASADALSNNKASRANANVCVQLFTRILYLLGILEGFLHGCCVWRGGGHGERPPLTTKLGHLRGYMFPADNLCGHLWGYMPLSTICLSTGGGACTLSTIFVGGRGGTCTLSRTCLRGRRGMVPWPQFVWGAAVVRYRGHLFLTTFLL